MSNKATAGEVVEAALARSAMQLRARLPGVKAGGSTEDVHQARVAIRRLRSDLRTFASLIDPDWARDRRRHLRTLGDALGEIRDLDVFELSVRHLAGQRPELEIDLEPVRSHLARQRARARSGLEEVLEDPWLQSWLDPGPGSDPVPLSDEARGRAADLLPALVRRPWRRLRRRARSLGRDPSDEELHRLRIEVKRCRYAVDAVRPAVGRPAKRLSRRLGRLQEVLGDLHDASVIAAELRAAAGHDPAIGFAAGQLTVLLAERADRCRREWRTAWKSAEDPALRRWF